MDAECGLDSSSVLGVDPLELDLSDAGFACPDGPEAIQDSNVFTDLNRVGSVNSFDSTNWSR